MGRYNKVNVFLVSVYNLYSAIYRVILPFTSNVVKITFCLALAALGIDSS